MVIDYNEYDVEQEIAHRCYHHYAHHEGSEDKVYCYLADECNGKNEECPSYVPMRYADMLITVQMNGTGNWFNIISYVFFELVGIYILYNGIDDFGFVKTKQEVKDVT